MSAILRRYHNLLRKLAKVAYTEDHVAHLRYEKSVYDELEGLQGCSTARCYGLFKVDVAASLTLDIEFRQPDSEDYDSDSNLISQLRRLRLNPLPQR